MSELEGVAQPDGAEPAQAARSSAGRALLAALRAQPGRAGLLALATAALAETLLRTGRSVVAAALLYGAAVLLLAATSARFVLAPARPARALDARMLWAVVGVGAAVSLVLGGLTLSTLHDDLRNPAGFWLWLASLAALVVTGAGAWAFETPSARWRGGLPATRAGRAWLWLAVLLIVAAAVAARVLWLDRIPFGINPDEGDRTATAMQIVRGTTDRTLFETGWYRIHMMYFYLLAAALDWLGIGYVQARLFTAFWGVLAALGVTLLGIRHFSWRAGLFAGATMALMGLALQFGRETGEATPTMALWVVSMGLLLEGARTGRLLPWIGAGLAGGWSLYFYPTGRMWALLALLIGLYLLVRWSVERPRDIVRLLRGLALAALASAVVAAPFFAQYLRHPHEFALRFQETTVLLPENAMRLAYYDPSWSTPRLLFEQLARVLGVFGRVHDGSGFWPMFQPVLGPVLALLFFLGLGLAMLRWRDPRSVTLALWFWVGIAGMVVTLETPNVLRMATAVPVVGLSVGLALDELIRRAAAVDAGERARARARAAATGAAALLLAGALAAELRFYFVDYARMNLWEGWNQEGRALTLLPEETLAVSLGPSFHMINSGWVRLLAPEATRGGVRSPGSDLPLPEEGARGLAFYLYPDQAEYRPWLAALYPDAVPVDYRLPGERHYFDLLHIPAGTLAATRGALLESGGTQARVERLGAPAANPPAAPAPARWSALLRVPQQWNYSLHVGPGPARLFVDGHLLLDLPAGTAARSTAVNLARGDHALVLEGTTAGVDLLWARMAPGAEPLHTRPGPADLRLPPLPQTGDAGRRAGVGLSARVEIDGLPPQIRQDNTLATCCLGAQLNTQNKPVRIEWQATLHLPEQAAYTFRLTSPAAATLRIDGNALLTLSESAGGMAEGTALLAAGPHAFALTLASPDGANGTLELAWSRPGVPESIVPETCFTPAPEQLLQAPLPDDLLLVPGAYPVDFVLDVVE